jgi:hypothetical protein
MLARVCERLRHVNVTQERPAGETRSMWTYAANGLRAPVARLSRGVTLMTGTRPLRTRSGLAAEAGCQPCSR